jgi:gliding motility-associated-like protein
LKVFKLLLTLFVLCVSSLYGSGQNSSNSPQTYGKSTLYDNKGEVIYLKFNDESSYSAEDVLILWSEIYGLNKQYSFTEIGSTNDQLGFNHVKYQLQLNQIPVLGAELIMHKMDHRVLSFNGHIYKTQASVPELSKQQAVLKVLAQFPSEEYKWNSPNEELHLKEIQQNPEASYYPNPKLVYLPQDFDYSKGDMVLAYKMDVYSEAPLFRVYAYINAQTGELVASEDRICHTNANGIALTRYSGNQSIVTDSVTTNTYRLRETTRGKGIETYNMKKGSKYGSAVDFIDTDNTWNNANPDQDEIATDAHWGAEKTWDYFWSIHGRNSFDGNGAKIRSYVHYGNNYNNAFWNGSAMTYGDGDSSRFYPLTSLDVCGHEVSHAVTTYSANLVYRYESGALNESFSDIFGNSIEYFSRPGKFSWLIGEDITPNGKGLRSMAKPNAKGHPDTYKGTYWRTGAGDNGGVHSNSGVQNFWYYLLCNGGVGTNDNNAIYNVDSIGISKAERIAYRNLTVYLTSSSQYADARIYAIQAASDLFGYCSKELIATTNAWHACGVGTKYDSLELSVAFTGDSVYCRPPALVNFQNLSVNAKNYSWYFGDGGTSSLAQPSHTYLKTGKFSVKLVGEGCFNGEKDSFEKTSWIVLDSNFDICHSHIMPYRAWDSVYDCKGMIYDNGGEKDYLTFVRDTFTVNTSPSDSIVIEFLDFDYENKYDYVYIYDGKTPKAPRIGRYTGQTLPNGGAPIIAKSGSFTIVHFSDQLVVGRGFKLKYEAKRTPLVLNMPNDTAICKGSSVWIKPTPGGAYAPDYRFEWSTGVIADSILFSTTKDTTVIVRLYDECTDREIIDSIRITVLPDLELTLMPDTLVCHNQTFNLKSTVYGGLFGQRVVTWEVGGSGLSVPYKTNIDTVLMAVLSDNCSAENDTAYIKITVRDTLSTTINNDTLICLGQSVDLEVIGSGGKPPLQYFWNNGLGAGAKKTVTPFGARNYTVTVSDGCTVPNVQVSVVVDVREEMLLDVSKDTTVCSGNFVDLEAFVVGGDTANYSFTWSHGLRDAPSHKVRPLSSQTYKLSFYDNCSAAPLEDSIQVIVLDTLSVSIIGPDTVCNGEGILMEAVPAGGLNTAYTLTWDNGLGTGSKVNVNPKTDVTYRVVLSDGCTVKSDTAYKKIIVRAPLYVTVTPEQTNLCEGDSVTITATGTGGIPSKYQFLWDNGIGNQKQIRVSPNFDTKYTVILTDNCSNFTDTSALVDIMPLPNISFDISPNPQCVGQTINFTNNTIDKAQMELKWDFGDGNTSTDIDPVYSYSAPGIYDVKLWARNSYGCADSLVLYSGMRIDLAPVAHFDYSPIEINITESTVEFKNNTVNANTYSWTFGDGGSSTDFEPTYTYNDTGHFVITLMASNDIGCQSPYSVNVFVRDVFQMFIPSAFSPNDGDNLNNELTMNAKGVKEFEILIYNRWGQLLYSSEDWTKAWSGRDSDGNFYPMGTYFYTARVLDVNRERYDLKGSINIIR